MTPDTSDSSAGGGALCRIAIASTALYTLFAIIAASGGSDASYRTSLWASWTLIAAVAIVTFGIGTAMRRRSSQTEAIPVEGHPVPTSVR
jgi:hypothetical protein